MNVYDFDKTICKDDTEEDFFYYELRHHPINWLYIPYFIHAHLSYKLKRIERLENLKDAFSVDKKFYKPYYNLANIFLADEKYSIAIEHYKDALKYNKTNPYIYYNCGCAYIKTCKLKK